MTEIFSFDLLCEFAGEEKQAPSPPVLVECSFNDVEQVTRLSQALLVTLATACVEKTAGDPFSKRDAVLPEVKKEMLEYLHQQSEAYASGSGVLSSQGQVGNLKSSYFASNSSNTLFSARPLL